MLQNELCALIDDLWGTSMFGLDLWRVHTMFVFQNDAARLNLPDINGALIREVILDSPADSAGLQKNDVVRSWDGKQIIGHGNLFRFVDMTAPNTKIKLVVFRDGAERELEVIVGSRRQIMEAINSERSLPLKQ